MNKLFNSYFGYSSFADDSSHHSSHRGHDPTTLNIIFLGIARKQSNDECVMMTSFSKPNSHSVDLRGVKKVLKNVASDNYYVCDSGPFSWHIMSDDMDFLYVLICKREYPQRCAHMCLHELQPVFRAKTGQKSLTSKEDGLNYVFKSQLNKFFDKYDDVAAVDSLALTMKKVDGAKLVMQQNIELSLQSVVKMEEIQDRAEDLSKQAVVFKKQGGKLKKRMYWQHMKNRLMLGALVLVVLGSIAGIISYFVLKRKRESSGNQQ